MIPRFLSRRRRGSAGLEAALALPAMLVLFGAVAQVQITSQSRVHLEQAAYAAARAGLVHKCPPRLAQLRIWSPDKLALTECFRTPGSRDAMALRKATDAARWALVAAAPTTGSATARGCETVPAAREILTGSGKIHGKDTAAENALCYVFEPGNVTVDLEWQDTLQSRITGQVPLRATVTFRYPLSTPFRRFVRDGERGDGTYWKTGTASVTLL